MSSSHHQTLSFLVGTEGEDDTDRYFAGDGALYATLTSPSAANIPKENVQFLDKEKECNKQNIQRQLCKFLGERSKKKDDVFIFYYGGHGHEGIFNLPSEEEWFHDELIDIIENHFCGSMAWLLVDCCYAGSLGHSLQRRKKKGGLKVSYGCVLATTHDALARGHWTLTEVLVWAIRKGLTLEEVLAFCGDGMARIKRDCLTFYTTCLLSDDDDDDDGISRLSPKAPFLGLCKDSNPVNGEHQYESTLFSQKIYDEYNEVGVLQQQTFTKRLRNMSLFSNGKKKKKKKRNENKIPPAIQDPTDPLRYGLTPPLSSWAGLPHSPKVGDDVFARWQGGLTPPPHTKKDDNQELNACYMMPLWYPSKIVSLPQQHEKHNNIDIFEVEITDPISYHTWKTTVSSHSLLPSSLFDNHDDWSGDCMKAQQAMAKRLKYITYDIPAGTRVKVLWEEDGVLYDATVLNQKDEELSWKHIVKLKGLSEVGEWNKTIGPFVWVEWDEDETWDLVPISHCCFVDKNDDEKIMTAANVRARAKVMEANYAKDLKTPFDAIMKSFNSAKKSICSVESVVGGNDKINSSSTITLEALCEVEGYWYPIKPLAQKDVTIETIAWHVINEHIGEYCAVYWLDDDTASVVPKDFVRLRQGGNGGDRESLSFMKWTTSGTEIVHVTASECS